MLRFLSSFLRQTFQKRSITLENASSAWKELPEEIATIRQRAANGHALDQVLWGKALLNSIWLERDPDKAREWFMIAAKGKSGAAYNMLGRCAQFGWGTPPDLPQAVKFYQKAADLGDLWGVYNLGICTLRGIGCTSDRQRAFTLFREAALKGHAKSMNLLARFMEEGWETPRNPSAALDWYRRSAEGGDYRGQHNYATALLALGRPKEALSWWRKAVEDATPDILQAMQRMLSRSNAPRDKGLQRRLNKRLAPFRSALSAQHLSAESEQKDITGTP